MLPIRDRNPVHAVPYVTYALIVLNVLVFAYQLFFVTDQTAFFYQNGLVPCELTGQCAPIEGALPTVAAIFASMFIHSGWLHIGGNMLFLWIFGDNVEYALGSLRYLIFYFTCGLIAGLAQVLINPSSTIVQIGASGAIAGVLGAYLILFPGARIDTLVFLGFFVNVVALPATIVLGLWFLLQIVSGFLSLGAGGGGVAFFAHIGGFAAGIILVRFFRRRNVSPSRY
jgi:membrane associated rhomboid family serine protease